MSMVLAVRATLDSGKLPGVPPEMKHVAALIFGNPLFWVAVFVLIGCFIFMHVGGFGKLVVLAAAALLAIGWDTDRGVTAAAFGGQKDSALMTGLLVAGAFALFKFGSQKRRSDRIPEGLKSLIPGMGDDRGKRRRGRRGR